MKKRVLKYIMVGIVILVVASVVLLKANPKPIRSINNILIDDDIEFYEYNEGYYDAAKNGHLIKVNKNLESKNGTWNIENILYDSKKVIAVVKSEDATEWTDLDLDLERLNGEKFVDGASMITRDRDESGNIQYVYYFDLENEDIKEDSIRLSINEKSEENSKKYVEVKLDRKILDKEPKIYNVDKTIEVEGVSVYIDKFEVYPLSARIEVISKSCNEEYSYYVMNSRITDKNHNENNQGMGLKYFNRSGEPGITFTSDYYKHIRNKIIYVDEVYLKRKEKCNFEIGVENETLKNDLDYRFEIEEIDKDADDNIRSILIKINDERLNSNYNNPKDVEVNGKDVEVSTFVSKFNLNHKEEREWGYGFELIKPIKGEKITFNFPQVIEYRRVDKEFKAELGK